MQFEEELSLVEKDLLFAEPFDRVVYHDDLVAVLRLLFDRIALKLQVRQRRQADKCVLERVDRFDQVVLELQRVEEPEELQVVGVFQSTVVQLERLQTVRHADHRVLFDGQVFVVAHLLVTHGQLFQRHAVLQAFQSTDAVAREVELLELLQVAEAFDLVDLVVLQVQDLQLLQRVESLDLADLVVRQVQDL